MQPFLPSFSTVSMSTLFQIREEESGGGGTGDDRSTTKQAERVGVDTYLTKDPGGGSGRRRRRRRKGRRKRIRW